ncbi:hypothetical protein EPN44_09665 [bacterium]|nr:MAG: hypothetical protein EPN44_09665 [bacterium]
MGRRLRSGDRRGDGGRCRAAVGRDPAPALLVLLPERDDTWNWYALPFDERCRLMAAHGAGAKAYHGLATQVISSSTGFDDWEWGVDLFSDDPLVLKRLIYELRFDEVSSHYAQFGPFMTGLRFSPAQLPEFLAGRAVPRLLEAREPELAAAAAR